MHPAFARREVGLLARRGTDLGLAVKPQDAADAATKTLTLLDGEREVVRAEYTPAGGLVSIDVAHGPYVVNLDRDFHGENLLDVALSRLDMMFRSRTNAVLVAAHA